MNKLQQVLKLVEDSDVFKNWHKKHANFYLCAFFRNIGNMDNIEWQVHYYWPENDTITVFSVGAEINIVEEDSLILKRNDEKVEELKLDNINVDLLRALEIADNYIKENYPKEEIVKRLIILQKLKRIVWNITCMTLSVNLLNVKLDAESGEVIEESMGPLLKYGRE